MLEMRAASGLLRIDVEARYLVYAILKCRRPTFATPPLIRERHRAQIFFALKKPPYVYHYDIEGM